MDIKLINIKSLLFKMAHLLVFTLYLGFLFSCGELEDDYGKTDKLVQLNPANSFTLLAINASYGLNTGEYSIDGLDNLIQKYNPDVIAMHEVDFRTTDISGRDMVTEIAYASVYRGQPRQGLFCPLKKINKGERGVGLFVKGLFNRTERVDLADGLTLYTMNYALISKRELKVGICEFSTDREKMIAQAEALSAFAETVKQDYIIAVNISADTDSEVIKTLERAYKRSCKFNTEKTYPSNNPIARNTYILTPLNQTNWGVEYVHIIGNESVSMHKGVLIKTGFIN